MASTRDLESILSELQRAAKENGARVTVGEVVATFGHRSFGPLLLLCGLLGMTPISAIPTGPTALAVVTILIAAQLLFGRDAVWLPRWLERRSVTSERLVKAVQAARKPVRFADRITRPRLALLTGPVADRLTALALVLVAACVPPLELLPFVAFFPALAIFVLGLGLVTRDGLVVLAGLAVTAGVFGLIGWRVLGG
jgi:hypothetical protein